MRHLSKVHWQIVEKINNMAEIAERMKPKGKKNDLHKERLPIQKPTR